MDDLIEGLQDALLTKDEVQMARVFFLILKDQDEIKANINNARKGQSPAILTMKNKLGREKIYYMAKKKIFFLENQHGES